MQTEKEILLEALIEYEENHHSTMGSYKQIKVNNLIKELKDNK